jgi:hypothetical protein
MALCNGMAWHALPQMHMPMWHVHVGNAAMWQCGNVACISSCLEMGTRGQMHLSPYHAGQFFFLGYERMGFLKV